jgi:hypothetical protein
MAERAALDDDAGWPPATEVKRAAEEPKRDTPNMQNTEWSQAWAAFIDARIKTSRKRSEKTMLAAIGDVLLEERAAHRKEVEELRARRWPTWPRGLTNWKACNDRHRRRTCARSVTEYRR